MPLVTSAAETFGRASDRGLERFTLTEIGTIAGLEGCLHVQPLAGTILRECTPAAKEVVHQTELLLSQW
jgi:hypothetical protein